MDEEERNHCCLAILLTRVGADRLRHHFIRKWDDVGRFMLWTDCAQNGRDLLTKFRPLPYEIDKVKSGDTTRWDLSLLAKALLNTRPPLVTSKGLVKSLKCLRETRNTLCHTTGGKITTADFNKFWSDACNALRIFGATKEEFKKVKRDVTLPLNELTSLMKQCAKQDDEILRGLNTIFTRLETLEQGQHEIKESQEEIKERQEKNKEEIKDELDQVKKMVGNLDASSTSQVQLSTEDVQMRSIYLKTSIKRQTEFQPKFISSHSIASAKTDEIFTNLMMQYGRRPLPKGTSRSEHLSEYSKLSKTPIERSQDIFIPQQKGKTHPKSILVTGKPGIGKSLFCQKLVRDWADDVLFEESRTKTHGFDFVYLLPFRQLNLIDKEQLTLRDFLNRCSLLDDHSNIDEPLFEYMIKHQEKVLFILDGYDEYKHRESITTDRVDQNHENNPRIAMPVAALLSKLLKGRIFGEAVVMVTSRTTESNELGGMNFHALVEINGFSPQQVEEFIGKYFQSNSQMKNVVLGHVSENEDLISLAHVPMFCFLVCWCIEWHIKNTTDQDLPVNMTELYSELVEIFELKHNSKSQYRTGEMPKQLTEFPAVVKSTLEKLSKLAVETMKKKMFNFEEKELMNTGLSSEEIGDLKWSGLLTSGPGIRTSATTITRYYCFSHLTLHEYFTARWYVENRKVPSLDKIDSEMVFQFFSGLSAKAENGEELMERLLLLLLLRQQPDSDDLQLFALRLLYEYGDKDFGEKMIERYFPEHDQREDVEESGSSYVCIDETAEDYLTAFKEVSGHQELQQHQQEQTLSLEEFGGSYDFSRAGLQLFVPSDAVNEKTNLTVKQLSKDTLPSPARELDGVVSSIIQFEPANLVFEKPVVATILHYGPTRTAHYVNVAMAFNERTNTWEIIQEIEEPSHSTNSTSSFVQVKLTKLTALTVVTRLITDTFVVPVSGCEVRSSVCQDVTLHFPAGGVDKSTKGSLRVLPMPDVMPMDIPNVQFSPIVVVDGFEQTDILKDILLTLPNPTICPAGHERVMGQVHVLCHEGIEWKDITETCTVNYVESTSTIQLRVKHFSKFWIFCDGAAAAAAAATAAAAISSVAISSVGYLYDLLKAGPKQVYFVAYSKSKNLKSLKDFFKIILVMANDFKLVAETFSLVEPKHEEVALDTGNIDMYPNTSAYTKVQEGFICKEDKMLTLQNRPCFKELELKKGCGTEDDLIIEFYPTEDKTGKYIGKLTVYERYLGLMERETQDVSLMNLDREERDNFFQLTLLLFRDGNQKLREFFKSQWPVVYQKKTGTPPPSLWSDIPNDATKMKSIETKPLKFQFNDQKVNFNSGDTNTWDFSLITTVLNNSTLKFVSPSTPESNAIKDLKEIRNKLIGHAPDAKLPTAVFNTEWPKACNALKTLGVTQDDIDQVTKDVKKPVDVLIPFLNESVKVEKEILDAINKSEEKNEIRHEETLSAIQDVKKTIREEVGKLLKCAPINSEEHVQREDVEESGSSDACID